MNALGILKGLVVSLGVLFLAVVGVGCEEKEDVRIATAQECLNALPDTASNGQIQECIDRVDGIESKEAYVIRCSGYFFLGGLTTAKIVAAFDIYDEASGSDKEAALINNLALSSTTIAAQAYENCEKTDMPGMVYIAVLVRTGTLIKSAYSGTGTATQLLNNCINNSGTCDDAAIGQMVVAVNDLYCKGETADSDICKDVTAAITNAGGSTNYSSIAQQLYQLLKS